MQCAFLRMGLGNMKRRLATLLLLSATLNVFAGPKPAQKRNEVSRTTAQTTEAPNSAPTAFQPFPLDALSSARIDPQYSGVSIAKVVAAIEKLTQLEKGEFETTADFEKRQQAAFDSKYLGKLGLNDLLPLVFDVRKQGYQTPFYYSYNADKAEVSLNDASPMKDYNGIGGPNHSHGWKPDSYYTSILMRDFGPKETYTASNAYGASVTVEKLTATEYGFATDSTTTLTIEHVPMEVSRAANELPSLKALFLVKPRKPYLAYNFYHGEPTRTNPVEMTLRTKSLIVDIVAFVFFSGKTGEIIAKSPGLTPAKETVAERQ